MINGRPKVRPPVTRSLLMLNVASQFVVRDDWIMRQARISLREQGASEWKWMLFASDAPAAMEEVACGNAHFAIINPGGPLTMAVRGTGPFTKPLPLRAIAVIPSSDQFVFAVAEKTGLRTLDQIREQQYPLRISLRGQMDHSNHFYTNLVLRTAGFSLEDVVNWGGTVRYDKGLPNTTARIEAVANGEVDAIFDEALTDWISQAASLRMRFLELGEPLLQRLEGMGLRRGFVTRARYPETPNEVVTLDYSGWPIYTHAAVPNDVVEAFCAGLEGCKDRIPWESEGPLPLDRMVRNEPDTPLDIPLHAGAESYWRKVGYL
jgi:TRAP-type uncharacterized transport system substrate-binding protein